MVDIKSGKAQLGCAYILNYEIKWHNEEED